MAVMALAIIGLCATTGAASAAPTSYPPPPAAAAVTVTVNHGFVVLVDGSATVTVSGSGFLAGEVIDITVTYGSPSGLRANKALRLAAAAAAAAAALQTSRADSGGNFSTDVVLTQVGTATITATGETSGTSGSVTETVAPEGSMTSEGTTVETTTVAGGGVLETPTVAGAGGGGLAFTGTNIAGPLTVGAAALIAGLALLFFGTRLAARRKHGPSAH